MWFSFEKIGNDHTSSQDMVIAYLLELMVLHTSGILYFVSKIGIDSDYFVRISVVDAEIYNLLL